MYILGMNLLIITPQRKLTVFIPGQISLAKTAYYRFFLYHFSTVGAFLFPGKFQVFNNFAVYFLPVFFLENEFPVRFTKTGYDNTAEFFLSEGKFAVFSGISKKDISDRMYWNKIQCSFIIDDDIILGEENFFITHHIFSRLKHCFALTIY